jgi:Reverse transcriptase (RNA-dependent DNA polymerase)
MEEEIRNLTEMGTWSYVPLPAGRTAIPCKWVFKRKLNADGSLERYRARLVLKGFRQRYGIDYDKVFAPVVRMSTVRLFFSIVASRDLECHQIDVTNAFVQGTLDAHTIHMQQPPGFEDGSGCVLVLHKSLYGLKQAPRVWHQTLIAFLFELGFVQSKCDGALFYLYSEGETIYVLLYVDDIQIASAQMSQVIAVKQSLLAKFPGRDLGETKFFLQMSVERERAQRLIVLRQQRHIAKLSEAAGLSDSWPTSIPVITGLYRDPLGAVITDPAVISQYRSLLGALMHLANYTRPDIAFAVSYLARFVTSLTANKFARVVDVIKYLQGTSSYGLFLGGSSQNCPIFAYCDADYAACIETRRSVTGYVVKCGIGSVVWKSVRQATVSRSTTESEYIAAGELAKEVQYIHQLARELGLDPKCIPIGCDNSMAVQLIADPISAARSKHIDIVYHHVRERVLTGQMQFYSVPTRYNCADVFTKPLSRLLFEEHRSSLGVHPHWTKGACEE